MIVPRSAVRDVDVVLAQGGDLGVDVEPGVGAVSGAPAAGVFIWALITSRSRSARLLVNGTARSCAKRSTSCW